MLVGYAVENFTSFNKRQEFCMKCGKGRRKAEHLYKIKGKNLLRFSAIYGSNASGKSNFINSMKFAQEAILRGLPKGYINSYNRTSSNNANKPSVFCFEICIDNRRYKYGFTIILNKSSIRSEWLYDASANDSVIFKRDLDENVFELGIKLQKSKIFERLEIYFDDAKFLDNILFLREMNRNKSEIYKQDSMLNAFKDVFSWFKNSLSINYPDQPISNYSFFTIPERSQELLKLIKHFGQGITDYEVVDADKEDYNSKIPDDILENFKEHVESQMIESKKSGHVIPNVSGMIRTNNAVYILEMDESYKLHIKTIKFTHGNTGKYDISEESDGMRRVLDLMEILFSTNHNKTYIIDEIDRSLHPLLTKEFVKYYIENLKEKNVQLIVTTHESRLLDLDMLRRDEIWFSNKGTDGNTAIYSLEEYNERFDRQVSDAYLKGRYKAIPLFGGDED